MFIKSREEYLILENIKQAKAYLSKISVPLDDPTFLHIVDSLKKTPNLIDTFTRMIFKDGKYVGRENLISKLEGFDRIVDWIENNRNLVKQLPKNLNQYDSLEEILDDIVQLEHQRKVNQFTKSLYKSMRNEVKDLEDDEKKRYNDVAYAFMNLPKEKQSQFTPLKYFEKNNISIEEFIDALERFVNDGDVNEHKKRVLEYINNNKDKTNVVYNQNGVLAIQTNDGKSVCELGSQKWCIVYAPNSYQDQYFGERSANTQYIVYNFNLPSSNRYSMYGITIKPDGTTPHGGCQDKLNAPLPLQKVYERTGMPEGTLVSKYKDQYDELMEIVGQGGEHIADLSYEEILDFSKKYHRLRLDFNDYVKIWLTNYVNKNSPDKYNFKGYAPFIKDMQEKMEKLNVHIDLDPYRIAFFKKLSKEEYGDYSLGIDKFIKNVKFLDDVAHIIKLPKKSTHLSKYIHSYIFSNYTKDLPSNIQFTKRLLSEKFPYKGKVIEDFGRNIQIEYEEKFRDITSYILKDKETLFKYLEEEPFFIRMLDFNLREIKNNIEMDLSDHMYLLYLFIYHINRDPSIDAATNFNDFVPENKISYKQFYNYSLNMEDIAENVHRCYTEIDNNFNQAVEEDNNIFVNDTEHLLRFDNLYSKMKDDLGKILLDSVINLSDTNNNMKISEYVKYFNTFSDFIYKEDSDIICRDMQILYKAASSEEEINELENLILNNKDDINIYDLLDDDKVYDYDDVSEDYMEFVGNLLIKTGYKEKEDYKYDICLYAMALADSKYWSKFYESIGLKYSEEAKKWYMKTDYSELGDYFKETFNFEDFWENYYWDSYDYFNDGYIDMVDEINLDILEDLAKFFNYHGFDLDLSPLEKYHTEENKHKYSGSFYVDYEKSQKYYKEDDDLRTLRSDVEDILNNSYESENLTDDEISDLYNEVDTDEIISQFNRAYSSAYNSARESEYFNDQASVIGDAILEQWPDKNKSFGNSYFRWADGKGENIEVIPDLDKITSVFLGGDFYHYVLNYSGIIDMDIGSIIDAFFEQEGKLDWAYDDGYVSSSDIDMDYFNEVLSDNLYDIAKIKTNESKILKLSEYVQLNEKELHELNNPQRFISEFGDQERAEEELQWYSNAIEDLNKNGGEIYRLVFLDDLSDLNIEDLGEHWCVEESQLSNFYETLSGEHTGKPYLITGYLKPGQVNVEMSYATFEQLPNELEVNLLSDPEKYEIKPYKDTFKAKMLWENLMY